MSYAILIYEGVEPIDIGATFGVLSMASRRIPNLEFFGVAAAQGHVTCAGGLVVQADHDFQTCPPAANLVVTGGPGWPAAAADPATQEFLRARAAGGTMRLSSICTGAMILAAAGLLDDKAAATKQQVFDGETSPAALLAERGTVTVHSNAIVESRGMMTSGGVTLGLDAMFHLLARDYGSEIADDVARVMEYTRSLNINREALGYRTD